MRKKVSKAKGITAKLVSAIVISVVLAVSALLVVVYSRVSDALLTKSEELLQATTGKTIQETSAWMNRTLTMLETQRDTIEYGDMDIPEMEAYIKHTVDQNEAYPAGLYMALTDGSLYHASFVPGPDFDAASKSWYQDGIASEKFILVDVYFDEGSQSYVVGASGRLKSADGAVAEESWSRAAWQASPSLIWDGTMVTSNPSSPPRRQPFRKHVLPKISKLLKSKESNYYVRT